MLRVLWILSLASLTIGARKPPWDKDFEKTLLEWASTDQPLASSLPGYSEPDSESSDYESLSENPLEYDSNCHPDSSTTSKASPVAKPGTRNDLSYDFDLPFQRIHVGGSTRGIPGEDFPDFVDFPATSFSCSDQEWLPGYYADPESRCQVYHACYPDRWYSYLCRVGKTFNQALLACDHWYNSKCSLAPHNYSVNSDPKSVPTIRIEQEELNTTILTHRQKMDLIVSFLPMKAKINTIPETSDSKSKTFAKRTKRHISTTESQDFTREPQSTTEATVTEEAQDFTREPQSTTEATVTEEAQHSTTESQDFTREPQATTEATVTEEAQHSTQSPDCPEIIKYINVEAAVRLIFDRLDNFVKHILIREAKKYMAASDAKKSCSTSHTDRISVSEKIKHKLCPRQLVPPMGKSSVITSKTDAVVDPFAVCHKKPVDSRIKRLRLTISPLTKTADKKIIILNYC